MITDLRRSVGRAVLGAFLAVAALVAQPAVGEAVPPPPPNPSDDQLDAGREDAETAAGQVGVLANQVAEADAALLALQENVALKQEETNRALIELEAAQAAAAAAQLAADAAQAEADAAGTQIQGAQLAIDDFAAGSYRQGSTVGSLAAFLGSESPEDLLARAELLDSVSGSQLDALDQMQRVRTEKTNLDSVARAALAEAQGAEAAAGEAKAAAEGAFQAAVGAEAAQADEAAALMATKQGLEFQLYEAQTAVGGLQGQRQRYDDWVVARDAEQAAAAAAAAAESDDGGSAPSGGGSVSVVSGDSAQTVINRAMSQLGVIYSWGGGDANGPTRGIRDGGVADSFGDYRKVGFDCSGLMIYAFAPVIGRSLPHYSGSQYNSGRKVPLAQKRPGDMLFWGRNGRIHHVALYIGNGQMIEAPYSGARVRVASVRNSGIMPYATRMF